MEAGGDGGRATVGRVEAAGQQGGLVQRGLRVIRVDQGRDGVQQAPAKEHAPSQTEQATAEQALWIGIG